MGKKISYIDIGSVSEDTLSRVMQNLACAFITGEFVNPSGEQCIEARMENGAKPFHVGGGEDTIPMIFQGFAPVCESCPVFINAFIQIAQKQK